VVAGTAADADRVAYVKTVRPTDGDEQPVSEPQSDSRPRYTNEVHSQVPQMHIPFLKLANKLDSWILVRHSGGPPFRRSTRVNPNPDPDPRNGGPPEWGGRYGTCVLGRNSHR